MISLFDYLWKKNLFEIGRFLLILIATWLWLNNHPLVVILGFIVVLWIDIVHVDNKLDGIKKQIEDNNEKLTVFDYYMSSKNDQEYLWQREYLKLSRILVHNPSYKLLGEENKKKIKQIEKEVAVFEEAHKDEYEKMDRLIAQKEAGLNHTNKSATK